MKLLLLQVQEEWECDSVADENLGFFFYIVRAQIKASRFTLARDLATSTHTYLYIYLVPPLPHRVFCASVRGAGPPQEHTLLFPRNNC